MPVLKLGFWDVPYAKGGIADILESKYNVVSHFWEAHGQEIVDEFTTSMVANLEDVLSGAAPQSEPFLDAQSATKDLFQQFIDSGEMDALGYPGVPTAAAQAGVNHRLAHPNAKGNSGRPSFKDTGQYEQSFGCEIEE
jgi:hypothetical protein